MTPRLAALLLSLTASLPSLAGPTHVARMRPSELGPVRSQPLHAAAPTSATCVDANKNPAVCNVQYYGGHVLPSVKVYAVLWGGSVDTTTASSIGPFYRAVTNSEYLDWLNEYSTNISIQAGTSTGEGTDQLVGRGTFAGTVTIAPGINKASLTDNDIQAELRAQIAAGHLAAPDENSIYMFFFPHGIDITDSGGAKSCDANGGFCAYHGTSTINGKSVFYGVHPDFGPGSGCDVGCGSADTTFKNLCSAASHELVEAITDAEVGLSTTVSLPLAWYDENNGEVGDMCNQHQDTITGFDAATYTVQQIYSQQTGNCKARRGTDSNEAADDFKIFMNPNTRSINAGDPAVTIPVLTAITAGAPADLVLTVLPNLPAGVSATIDAGVTPGQTATLSLSANAATAAISDLVVTVRADSGNVTHTASLLVQVAASSVAANDFSISLDKASATVVTPGTATFTVTTALINGSAETVTLSASPLPGVTASFNPSSVTVGGSSTLTLTVASNATAGTSALSITGTQSPTVVTHSATASLKLDKPPTASVTSPVTGAPPLSGTVNIAFMGAAGAGSTLSSVIVNIDGNDQVGASPFAWDTTLVGNGAHTLVAKATDADGGKANSTAVNVTVRNGPSVAITAPTAGTVLSGTAAISVSAAAALGTGVTLQALTYKDGSNSIHSGDAATTFNWNTASGVPNGSHSLTVIALDSDGASTTSAPVIVTVQNGAGVNVTSPAAGATIAGALQVVAAVTPPNGATLSMLQFKVDGSPVGSPGTGNTFNLNTTTLSNGPHTLSAAVTFSDGSSATAPDINVTVRNPPTNVVLTSPAAGGVSGTVTISTSATLPAGDAAFTSVQFKDGNTQLCTGTITSCIWDTTKAANSAHSLTVVATVDGLSVTSPAVAVTVLNDFTLAVTPPVAKATIGGASAVFTVNTTAIGGAEPIALSVTGLPSGTQAVFSPSSVAAGGSATLTVTAPVGAPRASATLLVLKGTTASIGAGRTLAASVTILSPPSASVSAPAAGTTLSGTVAVSATATVDGNAGLVSVQLLDGATPILTSQTSPATAQWDTTTAANGPHSLTARVTDGAGNVATSAAVSVTVSNTVSADSFGISLASAGTITLTAGSQLALTIVTTGANPELNIDLSLSGLPPDVTGTFSPAPVGAGSKATLTLTAGSAAVAGSGTLIVTGTAGNATHTASAPVTLLVKPTVSITVPASNAHLSGTVQLTALATVSAGTTLASVEFRVEDTLIGTATALPANITWDTATVSPGAHTLTARVTDAAGNSAPSSPVSITIDAPSVTPTAGKSGGCSTSGASGLPLALLGVLALARRRRYQSAVK